MTSAQQISGILQMALRRCPESNMASEAARRAALPILISAIIGGAEIYPLLLQWATRHVAVSPGLQDALRADCRVEIGEGGQTELRYGSLMQKTINYLAWAHPYSAAIGPPRKITENVAVDVNLAAPHMPTSPLGCRLCNWTKKRSCSSHTRASLLTGTPASLADILSPPSPVQELASRVR
jgi:hypothetical protein